VSPARTNQLLTFADVNVIVVVFRYSGIYPSPYGPLTPSTTFPNSSGLDESITSLVDFHLDRLLTYAKDVSTWQSISWICFETIPLIREGIAIRLALKELDAYLEGKGMERKKVWISFVFPNGVFPDGTTIPEIVSTILSPEISSTKGTAKQLLPVPSAIGLNCTSPHYIDRLTREFTSACQSFQREHDSESSVGFVIYPDGGLVYDTVTRTWSTPSHNSSDGAGKGGSWAENVAAVAKIAGEATKEDGKKVWGGGVLVGGCCKSGYEEIKGLKLCLDRA
jgi:homocysteine S-methyltransferase